MATSPDFSEYVDLTIYDTDAESLLNQIITYGRAIIPEWSPAAGEVEMMLAEVFAVGAADLASYINRLPGGILEAVIALFDVERSDGVAATGTVQFTMVDTNGHTIPSGTNVVYTGGLVPLVFSTDSDLVISSGSSTGSVAVTALTVGSAHNSVPASATVQAISNTDYVSTVEFTSTNGATGGEDPDTDEVFLSRVTNTFSTYSSALVTPSQIRASVLDNFRSTAYRCAVYDKERYLDRAVFSTTEHPGYVLVAVASQNTTNSSGNFSDTTLSASEISDIRTHLEDRIPAGLQVDIMSAEVVSVSVTASVVTLDGSDTSVVETAINNALAVYFDPNVWDWTKSVVRVNEVISLIDGVTGVDYVSSVSLAGNAEIFPAGADNFTVSTDLQLNNLGTLVGNGTHTLTVT
jgi:hypothetical protein